MNPNIKRQIILFSDPNFLALAILEKLIKENYLINIITTNKSGWLKRTKDFADTSHFFITTDDNYLNISIFSYAIFCGGFLKKKNTLPDFKKFITNKNLGQARTVAIFPFEEFTNKDINKFSIRGNAGIVYTGDLLGNGLDLDSDLLMPFLINKIISFKSLTLGVGEMFYPLLAKDVASYVIKSINNTSPLPKKVFLMGNATPSTNFWKEAVKHFPDLVISYDTKIITRKLPKERLIEKIPSNLKDLLRSTFESLQKNQGGTIFTPLKHTRLVFALIFLILIFPILTLLSGSALLYLSYKELISDKTTTSIKTNQLAKMIFIVGKNESLYLQQIPLLSYIYTETSYASYLGENITDLVINLTPVLTSVNTMFNEVLGTKSYDATTPSLQIKSGLNYLYSQLSLIQIENQNQVDKKNLIARQILNLVDFDKYKNLAEKGSTLLDNLPVILGTNGNKKYLILFQNNMELRPTGGFIGSYGIATFSGGRLNDLAVNDIYSADGQLKGHIEPPAPIKKYLGEANWWFRDSNWNPDFKVSAQRSEWFLNKEMNRQVDGTIGIDLTPIKNILKFTGPIFLPDYNLTINADNLYEKTQEESQSNFFPGSRKKASFLTALSRVLLTNIPNISSNQKFGIIKSLYKALEGRSIQIYLHDTNLEDTVDKLAWSGNIPNYNCGEKCYSDFFSEVEANVGVNKSNYFISRKMDFSVKLDKVQVTRKLTIDLMNSASSSLGPSGIYKTYMRLLIPTDANLSEVNYSEGEIKNVLTPDVDIASGYQEVGVYVEVSQGENKKINFSWSSKLNSDSKTDTYGLYIRKQAGTISDPLGIQLISSLPIIMSQPASTLTRGGVYTYNTTLDKDFFSKWTRKY